MAKVFQLNLHHATLATGVVVGKHADSVYLVQDTLFKSGKPQVRRKAHYHGKSDSRAGIYLSALHSCTFVPMHQFTDTDIATGTLEGGTLKEPLVITSVYLADVKTTPKPPTVLPKLKELVEHCYRSGKRLLCGLDSNAHSSLWGSPDTNSRGEDLEEFIFEYGLYVENLGNTPTWRSPGRDCESIIDITLTLNLGEDIRNWKVEDEPSFSDHRLISYTVETPGKGKLLSRNYAKADWEKFSSFIENKLGPVPEQWCTAEIENSVLNLNSVIEQALDIGCPKFPTKKRDKLDWWNIECEITKSQYLALERRMMRSSYGPTEEQRYQVKAARRVFKKAVRRAKIASFRALVKETDSISAMSKLNKILDSRESSTLGMVRKTDGTMCSTTEETLDTMVREHFPGAITYLPGEDVPEEHPFHVDDDPEADQLRPVHPLEWVSNYRIKRAISHFGPHKSAGPDGFKPLVLKNLPEKAISYMRHVYTACVHFSYIPKIWCHSTVSFLPKPGKASYLEPRSFRPISLTCFLFKIMELLVVWRAEETTFKASPLHQRQYAFRKNHSTDEALTESINSIEKALLRGQMAIAVYIDIKGAFDNVSTKAIVEALEKKGIDHQIVSLYRNYLVNRTCETSLGASSINAKLTRGGPQGGCASPPLAWNVPYDPLLWSYDGTDIDPFGFADDTKLVIVGFDFDTIFKNAQKALDMAVTWARNTGVEFCRNKTQVLFFSRGPWRPDRKLSLYGNLLSWSRETKYLGVTIDDRLTFKKHIYNRICAAKRKLMILRRVLDNVWGPKPSICKWAYTGIVRPAFTYGSIVWAGAANSAKNQKLLKSLQRLALIQISNVRRSTPTAALEIIYNITPLDLHVRETALKTAARLGISPNWVPGVKKGHQHRLLEMLQNMTQESSGDLDDRVTTTEWEMNYEIHIGKGRDIKRRDISCYTDGSRIDGQSGAGLIILKGEEEVFCTSSFALGPCSVYQAEVKAITAAAEILLENGFKTHFIDIMVDNQASLKALMNPDTCTNTVREAKIVLNRLGENNFVKLNWIRGHRGWRYNEVADLLAREACEPGCEVRGTEPLPSKKSLFYEIQKSTHKEWIERWTSASEYRQSKYFLFGPSKTKTDLLLRYPREVVSQGVRFITGHAFLRRQNKIVATGLNPPPGDNSCRLCEDCDLEETPHHILTECDRLINWRTEIFGERFLEEFPGWHPTPLIKFIKHKMIILLENEED